MESYNDIQYACFRYTQTMCSLVKIRTKNHNHLKYKLFLMLKDSSVFFNREFKTGMFGGMCPRIFHRIQA